MRPHGPRSPILAAALAAGLLVVAACGPDPAAETVAPDLATADAAPDEAAPTLLDPEVPVEPEVGDGSGEDTPLLPDREAQLQRQEQWRVAMDEHARGLLDSFQRRVYVPARDVELRFAEGVARVRVGEDEGAFRIVFDVARPEGERVSVVAEGGLDDLPKGADAQVRTFAEMTLEGPYETVVKYEPPIQLLLTYSRDRKYKIVTAPPHQNAVQASYRFDERELISHRGISVQPAAEITIYDWTFWRGRYLLSGFDVHGTGATCEFEYDDRDTRGATLLRRALLQRNERSFDVAFTWERVEVGAPDDDR